MPSSSQRIVCPSTSGTNVRNSTNHAKYQPACNSSEGGPAGNTSSEGGGANSSEGAIIHYTDHSTHHRVRQQQLHSSHPPVGTTPSQSTSSSNSQTSTQSAHPSKQHHNAQQATCTQHKVKVNSCKQNSQTHLRLLNGPPRPASPQKIIKITPTNCIISSQASGQRSH